jgi:hypothetical protein
MFVLTETVVLFTDCTPPALRFVENNISRAGIGYFKNSGYFCEKITGMDLSLEVSFEQMLRALQQLPPAEKIRIAERLKAAAAAENMPGKKASFTVLKTQGKPFKFNRDEATER